MRHRRSLAPVWGKPSHTLLKFRNQGWHGAADPGNPSELPSKTLMRANLSSEEGIGSIFVLSDFLGVWATVQWTLVERWRGGWEGFTRAGEEEA